MNSESRSQAAFLGLAIGDALGAPVEFKTAGSFEPIDNDRSGGTWNLPAGYWTDDTSMAICLAESILAKNSIDPIDLMSRFLRWYQHGENSSTSKCFDIGNTTLMALAKFAITHDYEPASNHKYLNTNGSLMRLAPVVCRWWNSSDLLMICSRKQSLTTHGNEECLNACEHLAMLMGKAIKGDPVHQTLQQWSENVNPKDFDLFGNVCGTLHAAMWAVGQNNSFETAVLAAVNLGGDSDTTGAVAGQLAGSIWGMESIPQNWLDHLHDVDRLKKLAADLWQTSVKQTA
jgi:ADP-ribosyl-[dinitrogen reductase] hydrolase